MWAQDPDVTITASEFGTAKSGVTVSMASGVSVSSQQIWKNGSSAVKANIAQIGNSANADYSVYYVEISSTKEIESVDILAVNNQSSGDWAIPVVYWTGAAAAAFDGYQSITIPCKAATVAPTAQHVDVSAVEGVKTLRIYRTIRVNSEGTSFASSNYTTVGDGKTAYIISVAVTFADAGTPCTPLAVNFAAGEGSGSMTAGECCPGKNYTIPTCGFTAPDGKEFDAWTSSPEVTITDGKFTMPDEAVTLTATWKDLPAAPDFVFTKTGKPTSGNLAAGDEIAVTGGTMKVYSTKSGSSLKWASDGLNFSGGQADQVIIETDKVFQVGSVISLTFKNNSLDILNESGTLVVTQAAPGTTYTVAADDGLAGNNVFRLRRNGSSYLQSIEITGLGSAIATWNVTFDMQGATSAAIEAQSVKNGKKAVKPADPEKTGYNFVKWVVASTDADYNFDATVTADVALKAVWEVQVTKYTVTYAKGDEAVTGDVPTQESLAEGANFTVAGKGDLAWADHKFVGWKDQDDAAVAAGANYTMPAKNVTLTAQWNEAVTYDVTFNLQGHGAAIETQHVIEGETATKPADPKAELYTFGGWYTEAECTNAFDFATTITAAKELFAKWTAFGEATSINIEQFVIENGKSGDIQAALTAANFDFNLLSGDELDDLQEDKSDKNCAFRGLKLKNNGSYVVGNIPAGKRVNVVLGNLGAAKVQINGVDAATALAAGVGTGNAHKDTEIYYENANNYYDLPEGGVLKVLSTGTSTTVLKGIILGDIPAVSDDATLRAIKLDGVDIAGFVSGTRVYNVQLEYGATLPEITATVNEAHAEYTLYPATESNNYYATLRVTAEAGNTLDYQVRFTWAPKIGVEIVKATLKGGTTAPDMTGLYAGAGSAKTQSKSNGGYKLGGNDHFVTISLSGENIFAAGDIVAVGVAYLEGGNAVDLYTGSTPLNRETVIIGDNYFEVPVGAVGKNTLSIKRTSSETNPSLTYFAVYRQMPSFIKSFKIGETEGVIDQENKTIAVHVAADVDVTSLTPTIEAYANGGATLNLTGAQDFTTDKTYTVSSAYAEDADVEYTVTVVKPYSATVTEGKYGTICLPYAVSARSGAVFYNIESKNAADNGIIITEEEGALVAGKPYIYYAENAGTMTLTYSGAKATEVVAANGLVGYLEATENVEVTSNTYFLKNNTLFHYTGEATFVTAPANKAFISWSAVPAYVAPEPNEAPRRVIYMEDATDQATGLDNLNANDMQKFMQDGKLYIRIADRIYDATGRLVK